HSLTGGQADRAFPGRVATDVRQSYRTRRAPAAELGQVADGINAIPRLSHAVVTAEGDADQIALAAAVRAASGPDLQLAIVLVQRLTEAPAADLRRIGQVRTQGDHQRLRRTPYGCHQTGMTAVELDRRIGPHPCG